MSVSDGEGVLGDHRLEGKRGKRTTGFWVSLVALVVLAVVLIGIVAGMLDPYTKRVILKAGDMGDATGLEGHWEQTALHCFESDRSPPFSSQQAARSIMNYYNGTSHLTVAITVAEMGSITQANRTYDELTATWIESEENIMPIEVGEEGILSGHLHSDGAYNATSYLHFHKGAFLVEMIFSGNVTDKDLIDKVGRDQAARLGP